MYPALGELLRAAHTAGLATTVTTNGMLLDRRRLDILEADCDLVAISLDGVPDSHDFMRNSPRAFDKMCARLQGLRACGIPFGFIFTLTFHNVHELDWVAQFAVAQGASLLQLHPLEPVGRATRTLDRFSARRRGKRGGLVRSSPDPGTVQGQDRGADRSRHDPGTARTSHPCVRARGDGVRRADRCGCRRSPGGRKQRTGFAAAIRISTRLVMGQYQGSAFAGAGGVVAVAGLCGLPHPVPVRIPTARDQRR